MVASAVPSAIFRNASAGPTLSAYLASQATSQEHALVSSFLVHVAGTPLRPRPAAQGLTRPAPPAAPDAECTGREDRLQLSGKSTVLHCRPSTASRAR